MEETISTSSSGSVMAGEPRQRFGDPQLATQLRERLVLPLMAAPMFLVSGPELVIAACRAGVMGSMPAFNARSSALLDTWLQQINEALAATSATAPYAVNLIVHSSNSRLEADLDICEKHRVPVLLASAGSPKRAIERARRFGSLVFSDAASVVHARRAAEAGVDALVLLCAGAGGNTGWLSPFAFVGEVRRFFDGPIVLAGAISRGSHIHAAEAIGADLAAAGTSFIAARESLAADGYRTMLIESNADDVVLTSDLTGIPANMLRPSLVKAGFVAGQKPEGFDTKGEAARLRAWRDVWSAGHGVGDVLAIEAAADIVGRFSLEYNGARTAARRNRPARNDSINPPNASSYERNADRLRVP